MVKANPAAELGKRGGIARARKLTAEQRRQIAAKAAAARWGKKMPENGASAAAGHPARAPLAAPAAIVARHAEPRQTGRTDPTQATIIRARERVEISRREVVLGKSQVIASYQTLRRAARLLARLETPIAQPHEGEDRPDGQR